MLKKIAILGAGSWGTALSIVLAQKGHFINLWSRRIEHVQELQTYRENKKYLPDIILPQNINFYHDTIKCINNCEIIVIAIASQGIREIIEKLVDHTKKEVVIVNVSKGLEKDTLLRISEVINEYLPNNQYVMLSGPSHAEEVSKGIPTTLVAASKQREIAELIQDIFINPNLRVYTNPDVIGVEIGGALKNIIALGAGICDGLGFGDNSRAALMTRGIREIARLGEAMGANTMTFAGLAGIGDLIVTCTSMHSRNRRCGILIGKGNTREEAVKSIGMVVEGIDTTKAAYELSKKHSIEMPIITEMYKILYEDFNARESVYNLMQRSKTHEIEEIMLENINEW